MARSTNDVQFHPNVIIGGEDGEMPDFLDLGREIQNRASRRLGAISTERRLFREFFGTTTSVVENLWALLARDSLVPRGGRPKHLLWALHFLKAYPKQGPGCAVVGGTNGAVDPKTHRKWVWAFVDAIAELEIVVVSIFSRKNTHNVRAQWSGRKCAKHAIFLIRMGLRAAHPRED